MHLVIDRLYTMVQRSSNQHSKADEQTCCPKNSILNNRWLRLLPCVSFHSCRTSRHSGLVSVVGLCIGLLRVTHSA
jgi:hypothetical protein